MDYKEMQIERINELLSQCDDWSLLDLIEKILAKSKQGESEQGESK